MEAQELRLGNWIKAPTEVHNNIEFQVYSITTDKDGYNHFYDLLAISIFGLCLSMVTVNNILNLHSHIDQLQSDSVQAHKTIFQLTNEINQNKK